MQEGKSDADRFNCILEIKLGELRSDKEAILNNLEEYFSLVRGSRNTVYTILATLATASIAISQFKEIESFQLVIVIFLLILGAAALVTRTVFHRFILKATLVAYRIERAYNDCIYLINDLQVSNILGNNMKDLKEFPPEEYRNRIVKALEDASQPLWHFSLLSYFDEFLSFSKPMKEIFKDKKERQLRNCLTDIPEQPDTAQKG